MDVAFLLDLLNSATVSKSGTAIAAFVLALLVYGLEFGLSKVDAVKAFLVKYPVVVKVTTLVLAVVPAVVMSLVEKASWVDAALTTVLTTLDALGLSGVGGELKELVVGLLKKLGVLKA